MKWTKADEMKAAGEGWCYSGGYVYSLKNEKQRFYSVPEVVAHLCRMAKVSEWHAEIYMQLPWTEAEDYLTRLDGWRIGPKNQLLWVHNRPGNALKPIEQYVTERAEEGSPLHMKAIATIAKRKLLHGHSPNHSLHTKSRLLPLYLDF